MTKFEWGLRCQRQFAIRTNDWEYNWEEWGNVNYIEYFEGFHDDPEGCADEVIKSRRIC